MRIALLSSLETVDDATPQARGFMRMAGRSVLGWQLEFALEQGCERIVCIANGLPGELITLQHRAERAGAKFHALRDVRLLSGLIHAADDVLVIGDGVAFDPLLAAELLGDQRGILTLPGESGVAAWFERIDRDRAWAGVMMVSGALIERLMDMPQDFDPLSSLLRLALQYGTPTTDLAATVLDDGSWAVIASAPAAQRWEALRIGRIARPAPISAPVAAGADRLALALFRRDVTPGLLALASGMTGLLGLASAVLLARQGWSAAGFGTVLVGATGLRAARMFGLLQRSGQPPSPWRARLERAACHAVDAAIVALPILGASGPDQINAGFAALVLVGLVNLIECHSTTPNWHAPVNLLTDRGTLAIILGAAAMAGLVVPAAHLLVLIALGLLLLIARFARLTRD